MITQYNLKVHVNGNYIDQYRNIFKLSYDQLLKSIKDKNDIQCHVEKHDNENTINLYLECDCAKQIKLTLDLVYWYLDITGKQNMKEYIELAEKHEQI